MIPLLLIHPENTERENMAEAILIKHGLTKNHPDILWFSADDKLGVEQTKQIKEFLSLKPFSGNKHGVVLIAAESLSLDAQNSLLKTLEEPLGEVIFILGASSEDQLLPTIISRCHINKFKVQSSKFKVLCEKEKNEIEELLNSTIEERFKFIEKLQNREEFLQSLTVYFRNYMLENTKPPRLDIKLFLNDLIEAEKWAKSNVNIRAILEYLMLKIPQEKI